MPPSSPLACAFFTRRAHLMTHSALGPIAVRRAGLRLVAAVSGGLQFLGAGVACALPGNSFTSLCCPLDERYALTRPE